LKKLNKEIVFFVYIMNSILTPNWSRKNEENMAIRTLIGILIFIAAFLIETVFSQSQTAIFFEDFDNTFPTGWSIYNLGGATDYGWGANYYRALSPLFSAFCSNYGSSNGNYASYQNNLHTAMEKGGISLEGYSQASLRFWYWCDIGGKYDSFSVNIRDQQGTWHNLFVAREESSGQEWISKNISLAGYAGQKDLIIQFRFDSDELANPSGGIWIDNVLLAGVGNLTVTAENWDGSEVSGATVKRFLSDGNKYIDEQLTDSDGKAIWNATDPICYNLELHYPNADPFDAQKELWAIEKNVCVPPGGSMGQTLKRSLPYIENIEFKNDASDITIPPGTQIPSGTIVRAEITVRNRQNASNEAKVLLWLDRSRSGGRDIEHEIGPQTIGDGSSSLFVHTFVVPGSGVYYRAAKVSTKISGVYLKTGAVPYSEAFRMLAATDIGENDNLEELPGECRLLQNYPNPFNSRAEIGFYLPASKRVRLEIFNVIGQHIAIIGEEEYAAGFHSIIWDGRDSAGGSAPSGIYFYKLTAGDFIEVKKMTLIK
jgi:hypothetical protein